MPSASRREKRKNDRKKASALKEADRMWDTWSRLLSSGNEDGFVHMLTQTPGGRSYPINHCHTRYGMTILIVACLLNLPRAMKATLGCEGIDGNMRGIDEDGEEGPSPFEVACEHGHLACVRLLSQASGIQMNSPSAFDLAVSNEHTEVVKFLLNDVEDGLMDYNNTDLIDCNTGSYYGTTHFLGALQEGDKQISKLLLASDRIDHHKTDSMGLNAMDMACIAGSSTLIQLLEGKGFPPPTNPTIASKYGRFAFDRGFLTERRALAEDWLFRDHFEPCHYCRNDNQRKSLKRCCGCLVVFYCSNRCQRCDWKCGHKCKCIKQVEEWPEGLDEKVTVTMKEFFEYDWEERGVGSKLPTKRSLLY